MRSWIAAGADTITFSVNGTITLTSTLPPISDTLTIDGPGAGSLTISNNNPVRVLDVPAARTLELTGVTVANGNSANEGGGIENRNIYTTALRVSAIRLGKSWTLYLNQVATFTNGGVLGARAKADGTVQIYKNGVQIASVTLSAADQGFFNSKGGKIGIWTVAASNALMDDFSGGTLNP